MFRRFILLCALAFSGSLVPVHAQDATSEPTAEATSTSGNQASVVVSEKVTTQPTIELDRVVLPQDGWVVVNAVVNGKMDATVGFTSLPAGKYTDVSVDIDLVEATPQLIATVHEDNGQTGIYEYDSTPQNDPPFMVNGSPVSATFKFTALNVWDQRDTNSGINLGSVIADQPTWAVVQADNNGNPGNVLGALQLNAGTNVSVIVPVQGEADAGLVWATLYPNAGAGDQFNPTGQTPIMDEEGDPVQKEIKIEDKSRIMTADGLDIENPTTPALQVNDQNIGGGQTATLRIDSVTAPVDGWVEVHADQNGRPGVGLGWVSVSQGANTNVNVDLDANKVPSAPLGTLPSSVWVMVHVDSYTPGDFDHDKLPGADEPVVVDGETLMQQVSISGTNGAQAGATAEATAAS